jgi:hypothetical protein
MVKRNKKTKEAEVKKHIEALAALGVDMTAGFWPEGAYDYAEGKTTWRSIFLPRKNCQAATLLDVTGFASTGADGKRVLLLSTFVCLSQFHALAEPINIVATSRSQHPYFLTSSYALNAKGSDVQITIFAWAANGDAAPDVWFDWRCRVVSIPMLLAPTLGASAA